MVRDGAGKPAPMITAAGRQVGGEVRETRRALLPAFVGLMVVAELVLLWAHPRIPSNDGPAHQYSAFVARQLREDPHGDLATWFRPNPRLIYPNWAYGRVLEAAIGVLAPRNAEKLFASAYLLALPLAVAALARALGGDAAMSALVAVPLSLNLLFFMGFFSFLWGLIGALFALAAEASTLDRPDSTGLGLFVVLAAATWLIHLAAFGLLVSGAAALVLSARRGRRRRDVAIALALIVLGAALLYARELAPGAGISWSFDPLGRVLSVLTVRVATSSGGIERALFAVYGLCLCGAAAQSALRADRDRGRSLVALLGAWLVLALAVPSTLGVGSFLDKRILLLIALTSAACVRLRRGKVRAVAVGLAVGTLAVHLSLVEMRWREFDRALDRFLGVAQRSTSRDALYVHLRAPRAAEFTHSPMAHVDSYVHLASGSPNFTLYQAFAPESAVFPVAFTSRGAERVRRGSGHAPVRLARIGTWADEILLWDPTGEDRRSVAASRRYAVVAEDAEAVLLRRVPAPP